FQPFNVVITTGIILCKKSQADLLIPINLQINSCDQNLNQCCELIEMTSVIQGQLFTILNETSREGGHYAGIETIKNRLLPWLGTWFSHATSGRTFQMSLQVTDIFQCILLV
uniref:Spermatogenesis associated 18 n=1 Tax=Pavo cristatus TaxID=9049 RepID=A0A8C9FDI7_PAVCR